MLGIILSVVVANFFEHLVDASFVQGPLALGQQEKLSHMQRD
jgi:hypothetical protein